MIYRLPLLSRLLFLFSGAFLGAGVASGIGVGLTHGQSWLPTISLGASAVLALTNSLYIAHLKGRQLR